MADYTLSGLTSKTEFLSTDLFYLRTVGNIDQNITGANLFSFLIGLLAIQLTNYTGVGQPAIAAGGTVEINGVIYRNSSEVAITGATANTTWYDILLTPAGATFTASFIARSTGVWSDSKQGLYDGDNRVVACVFRNSSDADWIDKNILTVINRTIKIKLMIGDWNMDITVFKERTHGIDGAAIRTLSVLIQGDIGSNLIGLAPIDIADAANTVAGKASVKTNNLDIIRMNRHNGGRFDTEDFNATSFNRGWIYFEYGV